MLEPEEISSIVIYVISLMLLLYVLIKSRGIKPKNLSGWVYKVAWLIVLAGLVSMLILTSIQRVILLYYIIMSILVAFLIIFIDVYISFNSGLNYKFIMFVASLSVMLNLALNTSNKFIS